MNARWGLLPLSLLILTGCLPQPGERTYRVSEVQLLFSENTERWVYFYGEPQAVLLEGRSLSLTPGTHPSPLSVPEALLVGGEPLYREIGPALPRTARLNRGFPGGQLLLRAERRVQNAWLFEGGWLRLAGPFSENSLQSVVARAGRPQFENLSPAETEAVLAEVLNRRGGRPVVLYEVEAPLPPLRLQPTPTQARTTALAVQYGLESELVLMPPTPPSPRVMLQGSLAAYAEPGPAAYLAASPGQMLSLWRLATGNQLPPPPVPPVDFNQHRVAGFFWGQKPTGGYSLQYVGSQAVGNTLRITLRLSSPAPGAMVTQALTSPFVLLEVPGRFTRVEFLSTDGQVLASAGN
ncbi:protease complex subunit PrcB family protein [Meiothermus sp. QL-1]|uniref:protease complex subunit PrcB family protein n=1 Tax=Meiothermus sp. QL-1 TaxID=2058095 RepID=UPI000E0C7CF0|nr:protease complex subunit PrcB family protein [Meiothermus sp. QL-1]RDI94983.1 protease complex subunit PrcB family protein [Meiothermus sp. QL-1]